ncbi:YbaB/EbfC family nucleoid-associated protein [Actinopolyspora sp. H202]|uniref:YbaB/EbfC family nucleoid-associated protein n=1 Tax=Actinopolyspora sp. H202 TaxID=1500456 RepID=UPI003EE707EC
MDVSERIQRMMSDFEQQAAKAAEVKDQMSELRGTARSKDGTIEVTVAPSGAVLDLRLE